MKGVAIVLHRLSPRLMSSSAESSEGCGNPEKLDGPDECQKKNGRLTLYPEIISIRSGIEISFGNPLIELFERQSLQDHVHADLRKIALHHQGSRSQS